MSPSLASIPLLLASAQGGGLANVELGLIVWTVVLFGIFAFVLTKLGWKPLLEMIEEREQKIRYAVESANQAQTEAQALLIQQKDALRAAGQQREDIVKQAFQDADQVRANLIAQAKAESERMLARAKEQIQREKEVALREIREQVADLAIAAAEKIVTSSLTPQAQRKLVQEFLDTLPSAR